MLPEYSGLGRHLLSSRVFRARQIVKGAQLEVAVLVKAPRLALQSGKPFLHERDRPRGCPVMPLWDLAAGVTEDSCLRETTVLFTTHTFLSNDLTDPEGNP